MNRLSCIAFWGRCGLALFVEDALLLEAGGLREFLRTSGAAVCAFGV